MPPREGARGLERPVVLCAAGRRALMGKLLEEQGWGGRVGGERQLQIYIKDKLSRYREQQPVAPVGRGHQGRERAGRCPLTAGVTSLPTGSLLPQFFFSLC